jgi:hypothetical protein
MQLNSRRYKEMKAGGKYKRNTKELTIDQLDLPLLEADLKHAIITHRKPNRHKNNHE